MINVEEHCHRGNTAQFQSMFFDALLCSALTADVQWELLKNTAVAGTAVVGSMNPDTSGNRNHVDRSCQPIRQPNRCCRSQDMSIHFVNDNVSINADQSFFHQPIHRLFALPCLASIDNAHQWLMTRASTVTAQKHPSLKSYYSRNKTKTKGNLMSIHANECALIHTTCFCCARCC